MGYTTVSTSMFSSEMQQSPENVAKVLDVAGWTYSEAAEQIGAARTSIMDGVLSDEKWRELLDKAGRRAFDWEELA
jgi:hypothetical protein